MVFSSKAIVVNAFGSYDCLSIEEYPLQPLEGNIEVSVSYCSLNFADLYTRQGLFSELKVPFVLGIECVGVIKTVGYTNEACSLKVGQRVICYDYKGGLFRNVIRISPNNVYPLPDYISFEVGATLFVNYLTAYFTLFNMGNLKQNETVFIQSCAGGVGLAATQLTKTLQNVTIIGTASESKHQTMKENGVDFVLSYDNLIEGLKNVCPNGVDLIVDNQCGSTFNELQCCLKPLGRIVSIGANTYLQDDNRISLVHALKVWWNTKNIPVHSLITSSRALAGLHLGLLAEKEPLKIRQALDIIYAMYKEGKIKPKIDSIWAFEDVVEATKVLGERRNIGKVLLCCK